MRKPGFTERFRHFLFGRVKQPEIGIHWLEMLRIAFGNVADQRTAHGFWFGNLPFITFQVTGNLMCSTEAHRRGFNISFNTNDLSGKVDFWIFFKIEPW